MNDRPATMDGEIHRFESPSRSDGTGGDESASKQVARDSQGRPAFSVRMQMYLTLGVCLVAFIGVVAVFLATSQIVRDRFALLKKVDIRGVGEEEVVLVLKDEFASFSKSEAKLFRD